MAFHEGLDHGNALPCDITTCMCALVALDRNHSIEISLAPECEMSYPKGSHSVRKLYYIGNQALIIFKCVECPPSKLEHRASQSNIF